MTKPTFEIDGSNFIDREGFFDEISKIVGDGWGKNLDALNDILCGAMGTPFDEPFILVWKNSALSRERLGYEATIARFEAMFKSYSKGLTFEEFMKQFKRQNRLKRLLYGKNEPSLSIEQAQFSYRYYEQQLTLARQHQDGTIFDSIMNIFRDYPDVEVRLE